MICGLLGKKLSHSYSPQIHKELGDYEYKLFEKEEWELAEFLNSDAFHGINVTIPYKKAVIPFCHKLSPEANMLGAVNTVVRQKDGTLMGHNTDYFGFLSMVQHAGVSVANKKVLVLGSGGASNTVTAVLKELNAIPVIISRNGSNHYNNLHLHADCKVIVNTTPVGMYPNCGVSPVDLSHFPALEAVLDVIYNPAKTQLLLDAEKRGLITENGLWMLVAQAKESAQWFQDTPISDQCISGIYQNLKFQMENIVLIGMPGCGKSTIGKILAKKLNKTFVDADASIEAFAGCTIPEIFQSFGEAGFRQMETKVLGDLGCKSGLVIATGGGCVTRKENYDLLKQNGNLIWIKRDIQALPTHGRPLSSKQSLSRMYQIRKPMYEQFADHTVRNDTTAEETADTILGIL